MKRINLLIVLLMVTSLNSFAQTLIENYNGTGHNLPSQTSFNNKFYIGFSNNDATNYPATYGSIFGYTKVANGYGYSYQLYKGHTKPQLYIRFADYSNGGNKWFSWRKLLDSGNDIESMALLKINGTGTSYINGNLGIGTTEPRTKLHVLGACEANSNFISSYGNISSNELVTSNTYRAFTGATYTDGLSSSIDRYFTYRSSHGGYLNYNGQGYGF